MSAFIFIFLSLVYLGLLVSQDICNNLESVLMSVDILRGFEEQVSSACFLVQINSDVPQLAPVQLVLKALPIWYSAFLARDSKLILVGLLLSSFGDIFLESLIVIPNGDPNEDQLFIAGLASFLLAHLCYVFYNISTIPKFELRSFVLSAVPMNMYAAAFARLLLSRVKEQLRLPILVYSIVIASMGVTAFLKGNRHGIVGAAWFVLSDSVLSYNKFVSPVPYGKYVVMVTYYLAQFYIASSTLRKNTIHSKSD
mmetsp:Transcript_8977/g.11267  ORF Transcript_8977/g.11267 Transcript_8977/m.11267 type:complete len:254 (+) Transcript_8977:123-884(+)